MEGQSKTRFRLTFHKNTDVDESYNAVSDRLDRAMMEMPEDVERGFIWKFNMDDAPILFLGATLPETVEDPFYMLERVVKPKIGRLARQTTNLGLHDTL